MCLIGNLKTNWIALAEIGSGGALPPLPPLINTEVRSWGVLLHGVELIMEIKVSSTATQFH
jgi:hypothetical protein